MKVALVTGGGTGIGAAIARRLVRGRIAVASRGAARAARGGRGEIGGARAGRATPGRRRTPSGRRGDGRALRRARRARLQRRRSAGAGVAARARSGDVGEVHPRRTSPALPQCPRGDRPLLERQGAIVTVSSAAGLRAAPESLAYCSSKAALADARAVHRGRPRPRGRARELRLPRLDADADGATGRWSARRAARDGRDGAYDACTADMPLRRAATAEEVAATVAWLALRRRVVRQRRECSPSTAAARPSTWRRSRSGGCPHDRVESPASRSRPSTSSAASASAATRRSSTSARSTRSRSPRSRAAASGKPISRSPRRRKPSPPGRALGTAGRAEVMHRLADLIDANVERLAAVECADMAMLLRSLRARVISRGARNFRAYADLAVAYEERVWESNGTRNRVVRMPSGPAVVITPWNAPFMLSTWKTAPALAAGCTVILKPAEWSPLSCSLLCDLVAEAGFPPGVFNVVQGIGEEVGAALTRHARRPPDLVHRLARDRGPHRHGGGAEHRPVHRRARREGPAARLRRRRPRGGGAQGGGPVRRRRPGLPRRDAAPRRGVASRTRSSSSSTASPTSTCSATRATTRRRSRR